jgi:hypothetical protein
MPACRPDGVLVSVGARIGSTCGKPYWADQADQAAQALTAKGIRVLCREAASVHGASAKTRWRITVTTATFSAAVRENEEVVPVNAVSTWVLPCGVTVGR